MNHFKVIFSQKNIMNKDKKVNSHWAFNGKNDCVLCVFMLSAAETHSFTL